MNIHFTKPSVNKSGNRYKTRTTRSKDNIIQLSVVRTSGRCGQVVPHYLERTFTPFLIFAITVENTYT